MENEFDPLELDDYSDESPENAEDLLDLGQTQNPEVRFEGEEIDAEDLDLPAESSESAPEIPAILVGEDGFVVDEVDLTDEFILANRPRKVYDGMWGTTELVTAGIAALAIFAMFTLIFFVVFPAQKGLAQNKIQQDQLEAELISAKGKYGSITDTETQVAKLLSSVNDFETRFLPSADGGKSALYERLNGLISAYGLINSNGPDYAPLAILDPQRRQQQPENERGKDKLISLFPGVFVTVTVEGPYQNIRRFMREVETSQQFIMISSVELAPADKQKEKKTGEEAQKVSETGQIAAENNAQLENMYRGKTHGETVSLKIEMAAYFRRPNYTPAEVSPN